METENEYESYETMSIDLERKKTFDFKDNLEEQWNFKDISLNLSVDANNSGEEGEIYFGYMKQEDISGQSILPIAIKCAKRNENNTYSTKKQGRINDEIKFYREVEKLPKDERKTIVKCYGVANLKMEVWENGKRIHRDAPCIVMKDLKNKGYMTIPSFLSLEEYNKKLEMIPVIIKNLRKNVEVFKKHRLANRDMKWYDAVMVNPNNGKIKTFDYGLSTFKATNEELEEYEKSVELGIKELEKHLNETKKRQPAPSK